MRKILCCLMLICLCPLLAAAQDVIVKRDGNTVVCRIVEETETEVVYKRWSNLQGNNYVMNISDIASIHYENGKKVTYNERATEGNAPTPTATSLSPARQMGELNNAELLNLAKRQEQKLANHPLEKRVKNLKLTAWIVGPLAVASGIALIVASCDDDNYDYYDSYVDPAFWAPGAILLAGGFATTTGCLVRAHKLKNRAVQSTPIYGHDFTFKNGSALSTNVCSLTDGRMAAPALGVGFNYHF